MENSNVVDLETARDRRAKRAALAGEDELTKQQLAAMMKVTPRTIERWEKKGMPIARRLWGGSGAPRYHLSACREWHDEQAPSGA